MALAAARRTAAGPRSAPSPPPVPDRPLVVVTGKGGVGKTTVAAVLATLSAREGHPTVLVQTGGRTDALALLGRGASRRRGTTAPARAVPEHRTLEASRSLRAYVRAHAPPGAVAILGGSVFRTLAAATPGLAELLVIGQVWELARARGPAGSPPTRVILDAPASGHGLALLRAPATFAAAVRTGPVRAQARAVDAFLRDPACTAVVLVTTAEQLAVAETLVVRDELRRTPGIKVDRVIVDAMLPCRFTAGEIDVLRACPPSRWRSAALHAAGRARHQQEQVQALRAALGDVPVRTLPFVPAPPDGPAGLRVLVDAMAASPAPA